MSDEPASFGRRRERRDPTVIVFLSIFLLLLGFFILLNAISEESQVRAELVKGSVAATFRSQRTTPSEFTAAGTRAGVFKSAGNYQDALEGVFEKTIPVTSREKLPPGAVLQVRIPPLRIFRKGRVEFHSRSAPLLEAIADILSRPEAGRIYEVELIVGGDLANSVSDVARRSFLIGRLGAFAARLRGLGVPGQAIRVGLATRRGDSLQLTFFDREAERARRSFAPLAD